MINFFGSGKDTSLVGRLGGHRDLVEISGFALPDELLRKPASLAMFAKPDVQIGLDKFMKCLCTAQLAKFKWPENCLSSTHCRVMR